MADNFIFTTSPPPSVTMVATTWMTTPEDANMYNVTTVINTPSKSHYTVPEMVVIAILAGALSIMTVVGNLMVMISFKIDKQLQTISNYFLFSLAVADLAIGLISMPLFTVSVLMGYWPLGPRICDLWLTLDYLNSNASVLNLLIISFDRYFSVTRPLTYRAKRTTNRAAVMIACAWGISLLIWTPWIYSWPYIEGKRTVPDSECYIQFIETNQYITFGTAIAAFYVPVSVMCWLYWRIWRETEKRQKDLTNLQAGKKDSSKRSNSSMACPNSDEAVDLEDWRRQRSESGALDDPDSKGLPHRMQYDTTYRAPKPRPLTWAWIRQSCLTWWHSGREDPSEADCEDTPSDMGYATPVSVETPLQSSVSRCTSLNVIRDPLRAHHPTVNSISANTSLGHSAASDVRPGGPPLAHRSLSSDSVERQVDPAPGSVYTILIKLPPEMATDESPSITMIPDDVPMSNLNLNSLSGSGRGVGGGSEYSVNARRPSQMPDIRTPLNAKVMPRQLASHTGSKTMLSNLGTGKPQAQKKKKKTLEKKAEKKAAKTLCAILLTFIITWTPYNILVLVKPLTACEDCIPQALWDFFYYLCYINSTINPMCYALCNASFRRTYVRILKCKWHNRSRTAMNRGFYN